MPTITINKREIPYTMIRRPVRCPRIEFKTNHLRVVVPEGYDGEENLLLHHRRWIANRMRDADEATEMTRSLPFDEQSDVSAFAHTVHSMVERVSREMQVTVNGIAFRKMRRTWGICKSDGILTFNNLLAFLPETMIEYIVVHEVTHLLRRKHNAFFYRHIERRIPDYRKREKTLYAYWVLLRQKGYM